MNIHNNTVFTADIKDLSSEDIAAMAYAFQVAYDYVREKVKAPQIQMITGPSGATAHFRTSLIEELKTQFQELNDTVHNNVCQ